MSSNLQPHIAVLPIQNFQKPRTPRARADASRKLRTQGQDGKTSENVNLARKEISAGVKTSTLTPKVREPLKEFTLFPNLAPELRSKIWGFAARSESRIFELMFHPITKQSHHFFKVSKQTNRVPAIMEVNRESRGEGQQIFEKRFFCNWSDVYSFSTLDDKKKIPCTWFNADLDIIYFGEDTCIRTVVDFFYMFGKTRLPRIAMLCTENIHTKCDWNNLNNPFNAVVHSSPSNQGTQFVGGGCSNIQALHGKPEEIALNDMVPGSDSTREVFIVIKSECDQYAAGAMPNTLSFRPALHNGLKWDDKRVRNNWAVDINRINRGLDIGCGPNRWAGGNCPDFQFVSLAPQIKTSKGNNLKHDGIIVSIHDIQKLVADGGKFIDDLKIRTGVDIHFPKDLWEYRYLGMSSQFPSTIEFEIGLYNGTHEAIEKCKEEIQARYLVPWHEIAKDN
ncbi:hypothetical protein OCU04_001294 [Sclerotinia nivalis]|uniref:2EXR domain-containing protein n=1 Tax=Sclerotinia nivalis TaxID=352851 RepID=A0A9X0DP93_9HELO|nr:hypothetical protein OCU04_001294 [Sclerotinia nivalis]